jgi:hypothetical protein
MEIRASVLEHTTRLTQQLSSSNESGWTTLPIVTIHFVDHAMLSDSIEPLLQQVRSQSEKSGLRQIVSKSRKTLEAAARLHNI